MKIMNPDYPQNYPQTLHAGDCQSETFHQNIYLGRRNLKPDVMSMIRGRIYNRTKKAAHSGENQHTRAGAQNEPQQKTAEFLAAQHGVSASTVQRDGQFAQAVDKLEAAIPGATKLVTSGNAPSKQTVIAAVAADALPMFEEEAKARQVKAGKEHGGDKKSEIAKSAVLQNATKPIQDEPENKEPQKQAGSWLQNTARPAHRDNGQRAATQAATATGAGQRATAFIYSLWWACLA